MERPKRPYSLHTRPRSKKNRRLVWYAQFRGEAGGYSTAVSTGCTRHDDAVRWCEEELKKTDRGATPLPLCSATNRIP